MSTIKPPIAALTRRQILHGAGGQLLIGMAGGLTGASVAHAQGSDRPRAKPILSLSGAIGRTNAPDSAQRYDFDADAIDALPVHVIRTGTPWHKGVVAFSGPRLADVLTLVGASGTTLQMTALNDYQVRMPASEALAFQPVLARRADGAVLSVREKGPLFLVFPFDDMPQARNDTLFSWAIWQLKAIEVR